MRIVNIVKRLLKKKRRYTTSDSLIRNTFLVTTVFFVSIVGIYFLYKTHGAKAAWFDASYTYRQRVPISNSGSTLTDYQVSLTLNTASLITAGKMQSDCDDLRFVGEDGTVLPYWIEENNPGCNNSATMIWVKVPSIPTSGINIYMYYGNSSATAASDGYSVFPFFDDFNGSAIDAGKWSVTGSASISSGALVVANGSVYTNNTVVSSAQNYVYEHRVRWTTTGGTYGGLQIADDQSTGSSNSQSDQLIYLMSSAVADYEVQAWAANGSSASYNIVGNATQYTATASTYHISGFSMDSSNISFYNNRTVTNSYSGTWSQAPYLYLGYFQGSAAGTSNGKDLNTDWVLVRKFAATPPAVGAFGSEEVSPGPIAYWKFDEGGGTTTGDSQSGTNGILTNGPVWKTKEYCITDNCLLFDGTNDYVDTNIDLSWSNTEAFTIALWVNAKNGGNRTIFGKGLGGSSNWEYSMRLAGANGLNPHFVYWNTTGQGTISLTSTQELTLNRWHHLTLTYDGAGTAYIYMDGNVTGSYSGTPDTLQNRANSLNIGGGYFNSGAAGYFSGLIDDVKVYSYARTADEIKSDYITGAAASGSQAVLGAEDHSFLSDGLVGYWKMDEIGVSGSNWTPTDSSGNNFHGTAFGNASVGSTAPVKFGNVGHFDGNGDYFIAGSDPTLNPELMTVAAWVKPISGYTSTFRVFASRGSGDTPFSLRDWQFRTQPSTGYPQFYLYDSAGGQIVATAPIAVPTDRWTHLVGVYDGARVKIYMDGKLAANNTGSLIRNMTATGQTTIGRQAGSGLYYWYGQLDDVRIYNRALSEPEIRQLYEWAPGPVLYHAMDANTGSTSYDTSGNGLNGALGTGSSAPKWGPGKYGSGLTFDGTNDYINIPHDSGLNFGLASDAFTLSAWIKTTNDGPIITKARPTANVDMPFLLTIVGGKVRFARWCQDCPDTSNNFIGQATVTDNNWHHVVFVTEGVSSHKIYIDGRLDVTDTSTWTLDVDNTQPVQIGGLHNYVYWNTYFKGTIDEVRIYNYARTQKQIVQDMAGSPYASGERLTSDMAVLHLSLDEGYGTTAHDKSPRGNNGTFGAGNSAPTWTNEGKSGKALSFDGSDDYVNTNLVIPSGEASISVWFKTTSQTSISSTIIRPIVSQGDASSGVSIIMYRQGTSDYGKIRFQWGSGDNERTVVSSKTYHDGLWHHAVMTKSEGVFKVYIDGEYIGSNSSSTPSASPPFQIGGSTSLSARNFFGTIDEVKIYPFALTPEQVKLEYAGTKSIVFGATSTGVGGTSPSNAASREYCVPGDTAICNAPVGEWKMDESTGTTVYDTSQNSNNGALGTGGSAPLWETGIRGGSLTFDGVDDFVNFGDVSIADFGTNDFTISGWLKTTTTADRYLISKRTSCSHSNFWNIYVSNGSLSVELDEVGAVNYNNVNGSSILNDGKWHYFSVVRIGPTVYLYVDGRLETVQAGSGTTNLSNANNLQFGESPCTGAGTAFPGSLDQVRIYDYARTPAQIVWEYSKGAPVAHYKIDECEGTTIYNSAPTFNDSAAGKNGSLVLGATGVTTAGTCATSGAWANGATGKRGASMSFDGSDDYVDMGNNLEYPIPVTVSAWIKVNSLSSVGSPIFANDKTTTINSGIWFMINQNGSLSINYGDNTGTESSDRRSKTSAAGLITTGTWYHVAGVIRGQTDMDLYINGTAVDGTYSGTGGAAIGYSTRTARIGMVGSTQNLFFNGQIDEVKLFNYALTPAQIKTEMAGGAVRFE